MENEINIDLNKHEALNDHGDLSDHGDLNDHRHLNYAITRMTMETLTSLLNDHAKWISDYNLFILSVDEVQ